MLNFDDETIERLFGADDAENEEKERFIQYFYYNNAYRSIVSNLPIRILVGHKGVGKSALLKRAYLADQEKDRISVWVRPDQLFKVNDTVKGTNDFNYRIEEWKRELTSCILINLAREVFGDQAEQKLKKYNIRSTAKRVEIIKHIVNKSIGDNYLNIYIDDIDRGWSASSEDIRNISALLNAVRDIVGSDRQLKFRIGLRTDVYFLVRTSDESTDKIERNVVWLRWTNHEILLLAAKRIITFFDMDIDDKKLEKYTQKDISQNILCKIIEPDFNTGRGHWANRSIHHVLLSLTRARPRDLVKLFHGAAKRANSQGNHIIKSQNLEDSFESYSQERLQDIINEFKSELPDIDKLLLHMRPTKRQRKTAQNYLFTTDKLSEKIQGIMLHVNFRFTNGRAVTPKSLMQFLYKIDFITARRDSDDEVDRKYFDESRFLAPDIVDFGYNWEIHPAYRWALQPQDIDDVFKSLR